MTPTADLRWMAVALSLARGHRPAPNPPVGAVVVSGARLVSLGWHERAGGPHAEVMALERAGREAQRATLYVTLEPCNHHGKTPPCVDAVLASGIARVVVGCRDPNPNVTGRGADRLRSHGVEVCAGPWMDEARSLIREWAQLLGTHASP
jgi:diaminohydroxyphosphoribosylaminopyrimidine deaminase/5-amino-6-(5-phosphoribosylamino)uracil reductase